MPVMRRHTFPEELMEHRTRDAIEDTDDDGNEVLKGHDVRSLGPSDSSDTGADMVGLGRDHDTSDRHATGERGSVGSDDEARDAADIGTDRVITADEAGLGGGLDQAEEARLGITDEELAEIARIERQRAPRR
jgi:hypothetical protein